MIYGNNVNLKLKHVLKRIPVLQNINFQIPKGRITCFIGKNGSGKTSLLHCIANLQKKYSGKIILEGKNIKRISKKYQAKNLGFVFQELNLFNNLSVLDNCLVPLMNLYKIDKIIAIDKITQMLKEFDIQQCKNLYPNQLSQGQKQKAAIVRALILNPKYLILDEPTASLDVESSIALASKLKQLNKDGLTIILTSHDLPFIKLIQDRSYHMQDGKIIKFVEREI